MYIDEFDYNQPIRHSNGITSLEVLQLLKIEFPNETFWSCWEVVPTGPLGSCLGKFLGNLTEKNGKIDQWKWKKIELKLYPENLYLREKGSFPSLNYIKFWIGAIKLESNLESFILFSYFSSVGSIGNFYFVSTRNLELIKKFSIDLIKFFDKDIEGILVKVYNGRHFYLSEKEEILLLHANIKEDILFQVSAFYENKELYNKLSIAYKRGILFVGPPGNGKTMMIRHLIKYCYNKYGAESIILNIDEDITDDDLHMLFEEAGKNKVPGIVILEDMESLINETSVTRSGLLSKIDGVAPKNGILIIGTTNNPGDVDPALLHRPSRFDRTWYFDLPDYNLRVDYLNLAFPHFSINTKFINIIGEKTNKWSFAYLKELKIASANFAIQNGRCEETEDDIYKAHLLLNTQFNSGESKYLKNNKAGFVSGSNYEQDIFIKAKNKL